MLRNIVLLSGLAVAAARAEVHALTLRQAVQLALQQNSGVVLAQLDEQRARDGIRVAKDPFVPKLYGGSGLAKTWGFPATIGGNAPSIFEARANMAIFNRPKSYELAEARENSRGAALGTQSKSEEAAYQTASLFLDVEQLQRGREPLEHEVEALARVLESTRSRIGEGREIPLEAKRAELNLARARQRMEALSADLDYGEASLAVVLGYPPSDRVQPSEAAGDSPLPEAPETSEAAITTALANSKELRRLESQMQAKGLEIRSFNSYRLPQVDLVAQYSLLSKFNNFQDYFRSFQRNNTELGVSIQVPLLVGSAAAGYRAQSQDDAAKLRTQMQATRSRITLDTQRSYQDWKKAQAATEVARLDLDLTREQVSVLLAQLAEGRVPQQSVDQARLAEQEKWIAFYDAQNTATRARFAVLRQTGTLVSGLR
ncbi:MAG TPA: TolC family protein [Bryobacteraceae bacterium]|nr:TolC family protein [Bryobacteraceae bacterium]